MGGLGLRVGGLGLRGSEFQASGSRSRAVRSTYNNLIPGREDVQSLTGYRTFVVKKV